MTKIYIVIFYLLISISSAYAGGVTDTNNGNKGDIFVSTGVNNGANSVGEWVNSSSFKGDKGDTGAKGDKGDKGDTGANGVKGDTGTNGVNGVDGENGKDGKQGEVGKQGEPGKGLEDRHELILEARLVDTKRTTWSVYSGIDVNNKVNIFGLKCVVKFGKSYEQKQIDMLKEEIELIKQKAN